MFTKEGKEDGQSERKIEMNCSVGQRSHLVLVSHEPMGGLTHTHIHKDSCINIPLSEKNILTDKTLSVTS